MVGRVEVLYMCELCLFQRNFNTNFIIISNMYFKVGKAFYDTKDLFITFWEIFYGNFFFVGFKYPCDQNDDFFYMFYVFILKVPKLIKYCRKLKPQTMKYSSNRFVLIFKC